MNGEEEDLVDSIRALEIAYFTEVGACRSDRAICYIVRFCLRSCLNIDINTGLRSRWCPFTR